MAQGWDIGEDHYSENPATGLDPEIAEVIGLWRLCRPPHGRIGGMAAGIIPVAGPLPEPGGVLDQGAWLMDAFAILSDAEAKEAARRG